MDIAGAIKEVFGFLRVMMDPEAKKKAFRLYLEKSRRKALEHAEKYILCNKELMAEDDEKKRERLKQKLGYHERKFFKYD